MAVKINKILFLFLTIFFTNNLSADNFYKYIDENGKIWFSNSCPSGRKCKIVLRGKGKTNNLKKNLSLNKKSKAKKLSDSADKVSSNLEERMALYESYIAEASRMYQIPANLIRAVMKVESNFYPYAVSWAGAQGLMQLMPGTADFLQVADPFNPRENILGGTKYLRILADQFEGDMIKTLAGYHAGQGSVDRADGVPSRKTAEYVMMVLRNYRKFKDIFLREEQR